MKALDLFCGGGGCSMGFHRAGFTVVGVDIKPQPRYPFKFYQADALEFAARHGHEFDLIHASPPCQKWSVTKSLTSKEWPDLIQKTREVLQASGKAYVIENVPGSPLDNPIMLCGSMFGLRVLRHRLFECQPVIWWPPAPCQHIGKCAPAFGKGSYDKTGYHYVTVVGNNCPPRVGGPAMGIDWMVRSELSQAIPPAYTKWIGEQICRR